MHALRLEQLRVGPRLRRLSEMCARGGLVGGVCIFSCFRARECVLCHFLLYKVCQTKICPSQASRTRETERRVGRDSRRRVTGRGWGVPRPPANPVVCGCALRPVAVLCGAAWASALRFVCGRVSTRHSAAMRWECHRSYSALCRSARWAVFASASHFDATDT